jgi:hypothetical protein
MFLNMRPSVAGRQGRDLKPRRILRVEPLESRTMLSVAGMAPHLLSAAEPFALSSANLVEAADVAEESPAAHEASRLAAIPPGAGTNSPDFTVAGGPASDPWLAMQIVVSRADLRLPFPMQAGDSTVAGDAAPNGRRMPPLGAEPGVAGQDFPLATFATWAFPEDLRVDGTPDDLAALVAGANRREAIEFRPGEAVEFQPDSSLEGGFIALGNPLHAAFSGRMDEIRTADAPTMMLRESPPLAETKAMDDAASFDDPLPQLSASDDLEWQIGSLTRDAIESSTPVGTREQAGFVALPGFDSTEANGAGANATAQPDANLHPDPVLEQADAAVVKETAASGEATRNSQLPPLRNPIVRAHVSDLEGELEGVPVDIDAASGSASRSTRPAGRDLPPETQADSDLAAAFQAGPAQLSHWASHQEEGGTIDLVEAALVRQELTDAQPRTPGGEAPLDAQDIRMDKGVGLFQAFELSTVPTQDPKQPTLTTADEGQLLAPPEAGASASGTFAPVRNVSEAVSKESDRQPGRHAAALPSAIVALLLTAAGQAHLDKGASERNWRRLCD